MLTYDRAFSQATWLLLGALVVAVAGLILLPEGSLERTLVARGAGLFTAVTMLVLVLRLPADVRTIWLTFWGYLAATVTADVIYDYQRLNMAEVPFPGPADVFYMSVYGFALVGLVLLARRLDPPSNFDTLIDAAIIGVAVFALVDFFVIVPLVARAEVVNLSLFTSIGYPVLDSFLLAALMQLFFLSRQRSPALLVLAAAMLAFMTIVLLSSYFYVVGTEFDSEIPWIAALTLIAVAASLQSAKDPSPLAAQDAGTLTRARVVFVALAVLLAPVLALLDQIWGDGTRTLWLVSLGAVVVALVLWRAYRLLRTIQMQRVELELLVKEEAAARREANLARQGAEAASIAKSEFLSVMSHELRTPLTVIMGMYQLIQVAGAGDKVRSFAAKGLDSSQHLLNIIEDILDFSSLDSGQLAAARKPFRLAALVGEVSTMAEAKTRESVDLRIEVEAPLRSLQFTGDALRLKQVLINLVGNAIKFTDRGSVVLTIRRAGGTPEVPQLEFSVTDTGIGLTPEQQARLFRPFTQVDMSSSRQFGGTGLGLVISQRLVGLLGGEPITVDSRPGIGSRFAFRLAMPVIAEQPARMPQHAPDLPAAAAGRLAGYRVLIVDDDEAARFVLRECLKAEGATVEEANDGAKGVAVALTSTRPYDAVLMDMRLPVKDGPEATRELRARGYTRRIVALTANAYASDREACLAAGMNDYITKPVMVDALVELLQRHRATA